MARFQPLTSVLLAVALVAGLAMAGAAGDATPNVHECPPGCAGSPEASAPPDVRHTVLRRVRWPVARRGVVLYEVAGRRGALASRVPSSWAT
jgi:hypothetical protein